MGLLLKIMTIPKLYLAFHGYLILFLEDLHATFGTVNQHVRYFDWNLGHDTFITELILLPRVTLVP